MSEFSDFVIYNKSNDGYLIEYDINDEENLYGRWGYEDNAVGMSNESVSKISEALLLNWS